MNLFAVRGGTETAVRGGTEPFALASIDYHAANEYVEAWKFNCQTESPLLCPVSS